MNSGIYKFSIGEYFYIGRSVELDKRWTVHLSNMRQGIHNNKVMNVYNKYVWLGEPRFEVLSEIDDINAQIKEEQRLLDIYYGTDYCLNLNPHASGGAGEFLTEEHKQKISDNNARYWLGKERSKSTKEKLSKTMKGMNTSIMTNDGKKRLSSRQKEIVECPHCNKTGARGPMNRWHFKNCREIK